MKPPAQLSAPAFARAAAFLRQARPLERTLFAFHFEQSPATAVATELVKFQNPDGGFFGLEADIGFDASTVLSTCHALHILHELGTPVSDPLVQQALRFLNATFDPAIEAWPIIPPHDNTQPHAPWWHYSDKFMENPGRFQNNPGPDVLACLYAFPSGSMASLRQRVSEAVTTRLELPSNQIDLDGLRCYLRLYEPPQIPVKLRQVLERQLPSAIQKSVERDPAQWGGYKLRPLEVAPTADSPWRSLLGESIEANLGYLIDRQTAQGCWDPHWNWGGTFPEAWEDSKRRWQAVLTLANLRTLRSYGRIQLA